MKRIVNEMIFQFSNNFWLSFFFCCLQLLIRFGCGGLVNSNVLSSSVYFENYSITALPYDRDNNFNWILYANACEKERLDRSIIICSILSLYLSTIYV